MSASPYIISLQRPIIKKLRRVKVLWDVALIVGAVLLSLILVGHSGLRDIFGEVCLAAGLLPFLLSFPTLAAEGTVGMWQGGTTRCLDLFVNRDAKRLFAQLVNFVLVMAGVLLLAGSENFSSCLAEVFAEVALVTLVTTLLRVPAVDDDESQRFLTRSEVYQLERSHCLDAPYASLIDFVFAGDYHEEVRYQYPAEVANTYPEVEEHVYAEHTNHVKKHKGSLSRWDRQVFASEIVKETSPGWDCPAFVAAVGRCHLDLVGERHLGGLLACLSGAMASGDRYICQAAVTSLGNLFFNTGDQKISNRLLQLWMRHEIANVREHCVLSLRSIHNAAISAFVDQMMNLDSLHDVTISEKHFRSQSLRIEPLRCRSLTEACKHLHGDDECRLMALISSCCMLSPHRASMSAGEIRLLLDHICGSVLQDTLESHVAKEVALECMARSIRILKQSGRCSEDDLNLVWQTCTTALRYSVFKQVREGAQKTLAEADYRYLSVYKCCGSMATKRYQEHGWGVIQEVLSEHLQTSGIFDQLRNSLDKLSNPRTQLEDMFNSLKQVEALHPWEDPVLLLYLYLSRSEPNLSDTFIQDRLNSRDRLERYVGLVCVGRLRRLKLRKEVVPSIAKSELISDIRDLACVVLEGDFHGSGTWWQAVCTCLDASDDGRDRRTQIVDKEFLRLQERAQLAGLTQSNIRREQNDEDRPSRCTVT